MGRATQGVTLIAVDDGSKLSGLQRVVESDTETLSSGDNPSDLSSGDNPSDPSSDDPSDPSRENPNGPTEP
jgi:DNA gyrase subunit A